MEGTGAGEEGQGTASQGEGEAESITESRGWKFLQGEIQLREWWKEAFEEEVEAMYQNLVTPVMLKHAFLKAHGFQEDRDVMAQMLEEWLEQIMPLIVAINKLNERIDDLGNGCKLCQKHMKEEIAKCLKEESKEKVKEKKPAEEKKEEPKQAAKEEKPAETKEEKAGEAEKVEKE